MYVASFPIELARLKQILQYIPAYLARGTGVTPEILPSSARKWISVLGPNGLKISARYLNALLARIRSYVDLDLLLVIELSFYVETVPPPSPGSPRPSRIGSPDGFI